MKKMVTFEISFELTTNDVLIIFSQALIFNQQPSVITNSKLLIYISVKIELAYD